LRFARPFLDKREDVMAQKARPDTGMLKGQT